MASPIEELRTLHEKFKFKNRLDIPQQLNLQDGDSILVMPKATVTIESSKVFALPGASFETIVPTLDDLIVVGLITINQPKTNVFSRSTNDQGE
jgi:hypothetical protein